MTDSLLDDKIQIFYNGEYPSEYSKMCANVSRVVFYVNKREAMREFLKVYAVKGGR
ncbi:hypothetical protein H8E77_09030 [bacterium]|nr:hypothetical protein [bacterium]